jgi:hypothetical protein
MTIPSPHLRWPAWRIALWGCASLLLLVLGLAMQFSSEVRWDRQDFLVFGGMLLIACGAFELVVRRTAARRLRLLGGAMIATAFLLVWTELAVGIFH